MPAVTLVPLDAFSLLVSLVPMSEPPSNNGRTMGGRFAPGHKFARGNPGARHRATVMAEKLMSADAKEIAETGREGEERRAVGAEIYRRTFRSFGGAPDVHRPDRVYSAGNAGGGAGDDFPFSASGWPGTNTQSRPTMSCLAISGPISVTRRPNNNGRSRSSKTLCAMEEIDELRWPSRSPQA